MTKVDVNLSGLKKSLSKVCDKAAHKAISFIFTTAKKSLRQGKKVSKPGSAPKIHKNGAENWLIHNNTRYDVGEYSTTAYLSPASTKTKTTNNALVTLNAGGPTKGSFMARYRKNLKAKIKTLPKSSPLFYKDER